MELLKYLSLFLVLCNGGIALRCNLISALEIHEVVPASAVLGALAIFLDCAPQGSCGSVKRKMGYLCGSQFLWIRNSGWIVNYIFIKDQNIIILLPFFLKQREKRGR